MAFCDLLMGAMTYPDRTPDVALRSGVALAKRLGGELALGAIRSDFPITRNPIANALVHLDTLARVAQDESRAEAAHEAACASQAANEMGVRFSHIAVEAEFGEETEALNRIARTRDLTLIPIGGAVLNDRALAEAVLFNSGRPVVVYFDDAEIAPSDSFETVAIAWDGSARAARAVAEALPILTRARDVRIFVAAHEKPQAAPGIATDLVRHLATHGVATTVDERPSKGVFIGDTLKAYVDSVRADLLIMGGFGHQRLQEWVLGGATDSVLSAPPCPVFMSH